MRHFVCLMAYGDSLITLSQLEQCDNTGNWRIIGTGVTRKVAALLTQPLDVIEILPDKAAFNSIKEYGAQAALRDFFAVRHKLSLLSQPGDWLVFERCDLRNGLLMPRSRRQYCAARERGAYEDRRLLVQKALGSSREWKPGARLSGPIRRILVNPCARYSHRWLTDRLMSNVIRLCRSNRWQIVLVDPCGQYGAFASEVDLYQLRPQLMEAAAELRRSDLYIGPDSFFMHLAYYYGLPHIGFFHLDNLYFMTPDMQRRGNWLNFGDADDLTRLEGAIERLAA